MSLRRNMAFIIGGWDSDALAFLSAAGITDLTIRSSINTYVKELKQHGLWTLITALYPFVGSNSTSHRYNLINPGNFLLTFSGGITHNSNGVTFDGSSGYANTGLIPSTSLILNNESLFLYSRTSAATTTANEIDMGAAISTTQRDSLQIRTSTNLFLSQLNTSTQGISASNSDGKGLYMTSRVSATDFKIYKNGTSQNASIQNNLGTLSNIALYIGARNVSNAPNGYVARNFALAGAGKGFNSTQANNFYTLTQAFQTALSRQV